MSIFHKIKKLFFNTLLIVMLICDLAYADTADTNEWKQEETSITFDGYTLKITEFIREDPASGYETEAEAIIVDNLGNVVESHIGGWTSPAETDPDLIAMMPPWAKNVDTWYRPNELTIVKTPDEFPFLVLLSSNYGVSNVSHSFIFYSTKPILKKIAEIKGIITKYQATGKDNAREVVGFYRDRNNDILFDSLTTRGQEPGASNASQRYSVESFKVTGSGVESINLRGYDFNRYRQLY